MSKSEDELLKEYVSKRFPETKPENYHCYKDTSNFQFYQLNAAWRDVGSAVFDSFPKCIQRVLSHGKYPG